jgi:ABC-type antimicrobial peptide transport system permease subunit
MAPHHVSRENIGLGRPGLAPAKPRRWPRLLSLPFAIRTAVRRWRSMLGMFIGVGFALGLVLTLMGLIGSGMGQVLGDFQQSGVDLYISVEGGKLVPFNRGDTPGTIDRATAILSKIRSVPGVQAAIGQLTWSLKEEQPGPQSQKLLTHFVTAMAVDGDPAGISGLLVMKEGRWLRRGNEVVLGPNFKGSRPLKVGDSLRLNGQEYEVVGVGKLRGFGPFGDAAIFIDAPALRQRGITGDIVNYIAVQTTSPAAVRNVVGQMTSLRAISPTELTREIQASPDYTAAIATYWLMDLFILFVAGMFVSNVLGSSVAERRLEFGTLRAIGLPSRSILLSVAVEALLIILGSFALGVVVSLLLGWLVNVTLAPTFGYDHLFEPDLPTYLIIFGLSLVLGIIAGFFPARGATKVDPLEVLREA